MRVLHTADVHIGNDRFAKPGEPWSRLADIAGILGHFVEAAEAYEVDLAIVAGDLFDGRNPKPREWAVAMGFIDAVTRLCPLVIADGNHDGAHVIGDDASRTMRPLAEMPVGAGFSLHVPMGPAIERIPYQRVRGAGGVVTVVSLPYPHRRAVEDNEAGAKAIDEGLRALRERATPTDPDEPVIFVGHLSVAGALFGSERSMRLVDDILVSPDSLDVFDYAALGHIHRAQRVSRKGWYAGSPIYADFGEVAYMPGFLLVDVEVGREPQVEQLPSGDRRMVIGYVNDIEPRAGDIVRVTVASRDEETMTLRALYEKVGVQYAEVVVDDLPETTAPSERAMPVAMAPIDALRAHLTVEGRDVEPYIAAAMEVMT